MRKLGCYACATAILMLGAQPCLAAQDVLERGVPHRSSAAFAGVALKLPLGQPTAEPNLRLQVGFTHNYKYAGAAAPALVQTVSMLEFGTTRSGTPILLIGGQDYRQVQQRLRVNGSTGTTLLIAGGVLAVVVIVALAAGGSGLGDTCPTIEGRRDHCINP
jgi:hypothetical protein